MATDVIHPTTPLTGTKFRVLIADDQSSSREEISRVLEQDDTVEVVSECANGNDALAAIAHHGPDVLFVDVQLPGVPGFDLVESSGNIPAVVFTSALDHYAARAFDAHAADYVLKPFQQERLQQAVERAKERVQMERSRILFSSPVGHWNSIESSAAQSSLKYLERLALRNGDRIFFQKVQQVDCFTSAANYVNVHCGPQSHRMRETMNHLEGQLDPKQFVRIHRCTIINIECLREFRPLPHGDYMVKLIDGKELTMSRNYRQNFRNALSALRYTQ